MAARDINISGAVQEQLSQFQSACRKSETEPVFHYKPEAFDSSFKQSWFRKDKNGPDSTTELHSAASSKIA